jgi:hypothetical protein
MHLRKAFYLRQLLAEAPLLWSLAAGWTVATGTSGCWGDGAAVRLFDLRTGGMLQEGRGHQAPVSACCFLPAVGTNR